MGSVYDVFILYSVLLISYSYAYLIYIFLSPFYLFCIYIHQDRLLPILYVMCMYHLSHPVAASVV